MSKIYTKNMQKAITQVLIGEGKVWTASKDINYFDLSFGDKIASADGTGRDLNVLVINHGFASGEGGRINILVKGLDGKTKDISLSKEEIKAIAKKFA